MSVTYPRASVKSAAESVGITGLDDGVAAELASDAEYRLRELIQESLKFARHAKRDRLTAADVNSALRLQKVECLYGYGCSSSSSSRAVPQFQRVSLPATGKPLFFAPDPEVSLDEVIAAPLPPVPQEPCLAQHWLAVEGVQPHIPQNPSAQAQARAGQGQPITKKAKVESAVDTPLNQTPVEARTSVRHVLSKEMQLFYETVTGSLLKEVAASVESSLRALEHDPGTAQLLPYLLKFLTEQVSANLHRLPILFNLMKLARLLLVTPSLFVDPYLHQLMPPVLTCIVGKSLGRPGEDHWRARDVASEILGLVCSRYAKSYASVLPRITKTLLHSFLDREKPLPTHYGAVVGLTALGPRVVSLLIPLLVPYVQSLQNSLKEAETGMMGTPEEEQKLAQRRTDVQMVSRAAEKAAAVYLKSQSQVPAGVNHDQAATTIWSDPVLVDNYRNLFSLFGEVLVQYVEVKPPPGLLSSASSARSSSQIPPAPSSTLPQAMVL